jgi:ribonuclease-3
MSSDAPHELETRIGHKFANSELLMQALKHSSYSDSSQSYERLEFLGDRVLGLLLAEIFYRRFCDENEGELSLRLHAEARMSTLAAVARKLDLANYIKAQNGFDVAENDNVLADVVESLMGAIYLDAGLDAAQAFLLKYWPLEGKAAAIRNKDAKSQLQEWCLHHGLGLPSYKQIDKTGPDHAPKLTYEVSVSGYSSQRATGNSRKNAEQTAAALMLETFNTGPNKI